MDTRDAFAAKVGNYSLLAAFLLQRLGQMRRQAEGTGMPVPEDALDQDRFDLLHDMFAEALRAMAPVWTIANQTDGANIAPDLPENRLAAPAGSISEGLETYDLIASLVPTGRDPAQLINWIKQALDVIETLRNDGVAAVLEDADARDFLDQELQPFLLRLKEASRSLVFQPAEGLVFAHR
jgi:hypothetical protein